MSAEPDPNDAEPAAGEGAPPALPGEDNLTELRARLDELQETVRQLGSEDQPAPRVESAPAHRPYEPPPAAPEPEAGEPPPGEDDALTYPAPAATNGHGTATVDPVEISALSSTVAIVDAGPFADLIELRHFEDDLASLPAVRDVRVRRFGQGRATIEVGMTGAHELGRELPRLDRAMEIANGPEGQFMIELEPPPAAESEADDGGEEGGG